MLRLGGVAVAWRRPRVHGPGLTPRVGGDVRVRGSAFVDVRGPTVALKRQDPKATISREISTHG